MDRQPWLGNVQATPQVTSPSHLRCTTKDFREAAEALLFREPYTIPGRQKDATAIRISSYSTLRLGSSSFFRLRAASGRVFERRVLSWELLLGAVVRVQEHFDSPSAFKSFTVFALFLPRPPLIRFRKSNVGFACRK